MFVFNRKEVYVGNFEGYVRCVNILNENKIKFDYKTVSRELNNLPSSGTVARIYSNGKNQIYYVYVNKNDYEKANFLLRK